MSLRNREALLFADEVRISSKTVVLTPVGSQNGVAMERKKRNTWILTTLTSSGEEGGHFWLH